MRLRILAVLKKGYARTKRIQRPGSIYWRNWCRANCNVRGSLSAHAHLISGILDLLMDHYTVHSIAFLLPAGFRVVAYLIF